MSPAVGMPGRGLAFNKFSATAADSTGFEGDYDVFYKGWQMYGSPEQGISTGLSASGAPECMARDIVVSVTASNADQGTQTLMLDFMAGPILSNFSTGIKVASTVAAAGLAALSLL